MHVEPGLIHVGQRLLPAAQPGWPGLSILSLGPYSPSAYLASVRERRRVSSMRVRCVPTASDSSPPPSEHN